MCEGDWLVSSVRANVRSCDIEFERTCLTRYNGFGESARVVVKTTDSLVHDISTVTELSQITSRKPLLDIPPQYTRS